MRGKRTFIIWFIEFVAVTAIGIILAFPTVNDWLILIPAVVLIGAKIWEDRAILQKRYECIKEQLNIVRNFLPNQGNDLRITFHVPIKLLFGRKKLKQAFDYIPSGGGGGRTFSIEKGIIGKTYREKGIRCENFLTDQEFYERMVFEYDYTRNEVSNQLVLRKSFMCIPVLDDTVHEVVGLIYLDANEPNTLQQDDNNDYWRTIRGAIYPIQSHLL